MAQIHALTPEGRLPTAAQAHVREMVPHPIQEFPTSDGWAWAVTDQDGQIALGVRTDGTAFAASGGDPYDVVLVIGQSNAKGTGYPLMSGDAVLGIDQYPAANKPEAGTIIPAVEPLLHQGPITGLTGTGFAIPFAHAWRAAHPGRRVLLVPAAWGATGFSTSAPAQGGTWDWTAPDDGTNLAANAVRQAQDALAAAGPDARLAGILWHQGEADGSIADQYAAKLDGLIAWLRTELNAPNVPFVVGQMSPDRSGGVVINAAHQQTPARVEYTAFAPSPPGLHNPGDTTHLSTRAHQIIGPRMADALARAAFNYTGDGPIGVENLNAEHAGDTITVTWDPAWCRVTEYRVEWRLPGGAWGTSGVSHAPALATAATFPAPTGGVEVRVITVNDGGESTPVVTATAGTSSPVTATATISLLPGWKTDVQTSITALRSGNVVTIAAWRLAAEAGSTGDVPAYEVPEGFRPPPLFVDDTEDSRGANVTIGNSNIVSVTNPSGSVSHHSFTYVTTDPFPTA